MRNPIFCLSIQLILIELMLHAIYGPFWKWYFVALWPESSLTFLVDNKILLLSEDEISLKTYFGMYRESSNSTVFGTLKKPY